MMTHQNVENLKRMQDLFTVTELCKYLTRYAHLNPQHSQAIKVTIMTSRILRKATIVAFSIESVKKTNFAIIRFSYLQF